MNFVWPAHSGTKDHKSWHHFKETENVHKFNIILQIHAEVNIFFKKLQGKFSVAELPSLRIAFNSKIQYLH